MNKSGFSDPTAEQAVAHVMAENKPIRFLPKKLHKAIRSFREISDLLGYELTEIRFTNKTDNKKYIWSAWCGSVVPPKDKEVKKDSLL